jgi:hypothetical protein
VPSVMQHALCPSGKLYDLTGCTQPAPALCRKISGVTLTLCAFDWSTRAGPEQLFT